ncbi:MAG: hypothetical protein ABL895_03985 [Cyclobacteriaceae bacterium]
MPAAIAKLVQQIVVISIAVGMVACKTLSNGQNDDPIKKLAISKLGTDFETFKSPQGEYFLFVQSVKDLSASQSSKFLVVQAAGKQIILEQSFIPGYVKWIGDTTIEFLNVPGILKENENISDYKKIIDVQFYKK